MASAIWYENEGKWVLRISVNGTRKKFTSTKRGAAGKREVLARYRAWEECGDTAKTKMLCSSCFELFLKDCAAKNGDDSEAYKLNKKIGRLYLLPKIGNKRMRVITKGDLQNIINEAKPHDKRTKELSKKYLSTIRSVIMQFMRFAADYGYYDAPVTALYVPKNAPTRGREILQPEQIARLFAPSSKHYHLCILFMVVTGVRPSEAMGLQWDDISRDQIVISRGVNTSNKITTGKNDNARRIIPMNNILRQILAEQRKRTEHLSSIWVFCSKTGGMPSQSTLRNQYYELKAERDLSGSLYSMRHTFISLVKNSMPEQLIKSIVGHSVNMDTFGVYGHSVNGELKPAADIIDLTFKSITSANK